VPAISFGSGNDWIDGGVKAGKASEDDYVEKAYHQPSDEFDPKWTFTGMARDLGILYAVGADLANAKTWPNWSRDAEFRATRDDIPIPDIPYTKFVLKNGLTVLVHEDHKSPVVAVNTWYHVGSKNEKPGKTGFAHLFEHLMFSGSANFNKTFPITAMEGIGATDLNGTTNKDRTNYFETVPTSMLDYVLFAESDRMGHLLGVLDQKKLDLQRGVVQNEKRQRENQPYGVVEQIVTENTWPANHPYSWTTIGSMKTSTRPR
jgi:hypothetical protein